MRRSASALLATVLMGACGGPATTAVEVQWEASFEAALEKAKAEGKPVMVDFWAEWCGYCHMLDRTTYRDEAVVKMSNEFVSVKVNTEGEEKETEVASRYMVTSLPTIAFVSPGGRPLLRLNGYIPGPTFARGMEEARKRATEVLAWEAALVKNYQDVAALIGLGTWEFKELTKMAERDPEQRMSIKMFEDAQSLLTRASHLDAERPASDRKRVRTSLGLLHGFAGHFEDGVSLLKEGLALQPPDPADARAHLGLGEMYLMQHKDDLARAELRKVVSGYPGSEETTLAEGYLASLDAH